MNNGLVQGQETLSQYEQVLAGYADQLAPSSAITNTGWLLLGAGALGIALILWIK